MYRNLETHSFCVHNRRLWLFLLFIVILSISLTHLTVGCGNYTTTLEQREVTISSEQTSQVEKTRLTEAEITSSPVLQHTPKDYIIETGTDIPSNLNPLLVENDASRRVTDNMFDSLLRVNAVSAALEPGLAVTWEFSEDLSTITFGLRSGVLWHDGKPFTAKDVEFTFDSIRHPASQSPLRANLVNVKHFSAVDAHTFIVTLKQPVCSALYAIGQIPIISQSYFEATNPDLQSDTAANLYLEQVVGTGPYRFKSRLPTGEIHLERTEGYFGGVPQILEWVYRPAADPSQILNSLQAGETDLALIPAENIQPLQQIERFRFITSPRAEYYVLMLNNKHPFLKDVRVRQALAHAIDRVQLVQELLGGYGQVIESSWLPGHWAYSNPDISFPYDPERANHLLEEAGWTDSDGDGLLDQDGELLQVSISVNAENDLRKRIALAVQQDWIEVGVSAEIHFVEFHTLVEELFAPDFDTVVFSWPIHQDPDQHLLWASAESELEGTFNFVSYANPVVDEALMQGLIAPACEPELRVRAYQTAISSITSEEPYIFLFVPQDILVVNRQVSGLEVGPYAGWGWNIENWRLNTNAE